MYKTCPFCEWYAVRETDHAGVFECSHCKKSFNINLQWRNVEEAYSAHGLIPVLDLKISDDVAGESQFHWSTEKKALLDGEVYSKLAGYLGEFSVENCTWWFECRNDVTLRLNGNVQKKGRCALSPDDRLEFLECPGIVFKVILRFRQGECTFSAPGELLREPPPRQARYNIGSDAGICNVVITNTAPLLAKITEENKGDFWLTDITSPTGVYLNGKRIRHKKIMQGDVIQIAGHKFFWDSTNHLCCHTGFNGYNLEIDQVSVRRKGNQILDKISFSAKAGEFIGILGPSGCGKSSLLQRLVGLDHFDSGDALLNGHCFLEGSHQPSPAQASLFKKINAYIPQQVALHNDLTLEQELSCFAHLHQCNVDHQQVLNLVGLADHSKSIIGSLSGGQQRRAGIALELLRSPEILMLDEPTAGLDPATETEIMEYLRRIANQRKTVLCSTHIMENLDLFDKVLILVKGIVVFFGPPRDMMHYFDIEKPLDLYRLFECNSAEEQRNLAYAWRDFYVQNVEKKSNDKVPVEADLPSPPEKEQMVNLKQITGYMRRFATEFFSFLNVQAPWKAAFWGSTLFLQFFLQPFLIVLTVKLACAYKLTDSMDTDEVMFFFALAVFWLGMNNSIRELVRERIPWRCLDRLKQIPLSSYLLSRFSWSAILCLFQTGIFTSFIFLLPEFNVCNGYPVVEGFQFRFSTFFILYLVCLMGSWIALAVSALFKKESAAVSLLPILLIPVLFFSQPIIRADILTNPEDTTKKYNELSVHITTIMPCHEPQMLMGKINNEKAAQEDWGRMLRNTLIYLIAAVFLTVFFQNKNEREWDGRT